MEEKTSERRYKAFISYRHRPLDMAYAKKLHRRIERYRIPKDLRKDGEKKLGLVFRDQDELPIANNLSENIRIALDHSEYLIVVCSPDTPESVWVQREIEYFLEHHSRDNVLALLIRGTPEESFSPQLTEIRDADGNVMDRIEPLAANIVADSEVKRNRLFRTESLRILASLIGCPYDALYRREQRYRTRRTVIAGAGVLLVAAAFIGLLLNRNAKIAEQLRLSKINEAKTLAALSESARKEGDYRGALEKALDALPGRDPDRPYVPEAEEALADLLSPYQHSLCMRRLQSVTQENEIVSVSASDDGEYMATLDLNGLVSLYEMSSGRNIWSHMYSETDIYGVVPGRSNMDSLFAESDKEIHIIGNRGIYVTDTVLQHVFFSFEGETIWARDDMHVHAVNASNGLFLCSRSDNEMFSAVILDGRKGEEITKLSCKEKTYAYISVLAGAVSDDGKYAAMLLKDFDEETAALFVFDLVGGTSEEIGRFLDTSAIEYRAVFMPDDSLVLACCGDSEYMGEHYGDLWNGPYVALFDRGGGFAQSFLTNLDFGTMPSMHNSSIDYMGHVDYLGTGNDVIVIASRTRLAMLERTGNVRWLSDLPDHVMAAHLYDDENISLVMANGLVTICNPDGELTSNYYLAYIDLDFAVSAAAVAPGDRLRLCRCVVVPRRKSNISLTVGINDNPDHTEIDGSADTDRSADVFLSPDQTRLVSIYTNKYGVAHLECFDLTGNRAKTETDLELPSGTGRSYYDCIQRAVVTNSGKLILGNTVIDLDTWQWKYLTRSGERDESLDTMSYSCQNQDTEKVLTATVEMGEEGAFLLLFEDGDLTDAVSIPLKDESFGSYLSFAPDYRILGAGANGYVILSMQGFLEDERHYAIYSVNDRVWSDAPYLDPTMDEYITMAEDNPWLIHQKKDGSVVLVDIKESKELRTLASDLSAGNAANYAFLKNDRELIVFYLNGTMKIFDCYTGEVLHRSDFGSNGIRFPSGSRLETSFSSDGKRLMIFYSNPVYTSSLFIMLDTDSYERVASELDVLFWLPKKDRFLLRPYACPMYLSPLYTLEDLEELGETILKTGLPH